MAGLAMALAFAAGFGLVFVALTHFLPQIRSFLNREEERIEETLTDIFWTGAKPRTLVIVKYLLPFVGFLAVFVATGSPLFGLLLAVVLYLAPAKLLENLAQRRRDKLEAQVQDVISSLSATTKSGMNLIQSVEEMATRLPAPVSEEFSIIYQRIQAGQTVEAALRAAEERLRLPRLSLVFQSIIVSQQRGGRLTALLTRLADSLREIERVEERVKTETSGIKLASKLMASMPILIMGILYMMSPEHIKILFDTLIGNAILVVVAILDYIGFAMIKKIADIDF